jgi:hypothetical protein
MLKTLSAITLACFSCAAQAADCYGVPEAVKMGEYGAQEAYVIVSMGAKDYRLGRYDAEGTKIRLSLVQTALVAEKQIKLRFWNTDSCDLASENKSIPNSVQLLGPP